MDHRLVTWARAVKARQAWRRKKWGRWAGDRGALPVLWFFTDAVRLPDPRPAIAALPYGLCGVVFRHDGLPGRAALARAVARQCRMSGIPMVVAGDARLAAAIGAGVHLRGGRSEHLARRLMAQRAGLTTSSAHSRVELRRACRAGADAIFLSPALPTPSHAGQAALGIVRWVGLARRYPGSVMALGGVDGQTARRLPIWCCGVGAITALLVQPSGD